MKKLWLYAISGVALLCAVGYAQTNYTSEQLIARVAPATVMILTGEGAGRLTATGSGVIVRESGVLLTAYHVIKGAQEVQVKLKSGEVFDHVELLAVDERRDVAALRIAAKGLPVLPTAEAEVGERVYVVSNPAGLAWTAADGLLSAIRLSDEVVGAGSGHKLLQFSAPVSPGSSGGLLVNAHGRLLGIIVASKGGQSLNFAVPINSVAGLADTTNGTPLGSGKALQLPPPPAPNTSAAIANTDVSERMRAIKAIYIHSRTSYCNTAQLLNELQKRPEFAAWKILLVNDSSLADAALEIDRPLFTFIYTFELTDNRTSVILASGKLTAWDGNTAAPGLAKEIVKRLKAARPLPEMSKAKSAAQ